MLETLEDILSRVTKDAQNSDRKKAPRKKWRKPVVYSRKGPKDKKQYYVQFEFWSPEQWKFVTIRIMNGINHKSFNQKVRKKTAELKAIAIEELLKKGVVPRKVRDEYTEDYLTDQKIKEINILDAIERVLLNSKHHKEPYRLKAYSKWLKKHGYKYSLPKEIKKKDIVPFLDTFLYQDNGEPKGQTNWNNYRSALYTAFQIMKSEDIVDINPVDGIRKLKATPSKHEKFTELELQKIHVELEKTDPYLHTFVKMVEYQFLRPIEVVRLKCGNIDLKNKVVTYVQKKGKEYVRMNKRIPDILVQDLSKYDLSNPDFLVFSSKGISDHLVSDTNNRGYWSDRYKNLVSGFMELRKGQGLYSHRHNGIVNLMNALRSEGLDYFTAERKAMVYTGHTSIASFRKYLRGLSVWLPDDYTHLL